MDQNEKILESIYGPVLVLAPYPSPYHMEVSAEIAVRLAEMDQKVTFCYVAENLPYNDFMQTRSKLLGCSVDKHVRALIRIVLGQGVQIANSPEMSNQLVKSCSDYSINFSGDLEELKKYLYKGHPLGLAVASSFISIKRNSRLNVTRHIRLIRKALFSSAMIYERTLMLLRQHEPITAVTCNGRSAVSAPVVHACEKVGVRLIRHENGTLRNSFCLYEESVHSASYMRRRIIDSWENAFEPERSLVAKRFFEKSLSPERNPFIRQQKFGNVPKTNASGTKKIVFFTSSDDEREALTFQDSDRGYWTDQISAVRNVAEIVSRIGKTDFYVRIHPHQMTKSKEDRDFWDKLSIEGCQVISSFSPVDSYALMKSSDIVITYGSTVGVEATYYGIPSVLMCRDTYYSGLNICYEPNNPTELEFLLSNSHCLKAKPKETVFPYGFYYETSGMKSKYFDWINDHEIVFLGHKLSVVTKRYLFISFIYRNLFKRVLV